MIPAVRLGTHELEELTEQHLRRAKLRRLNQVRDQAKNFAKHLREEGQDVRKREMRKIERDIASKTQKEVKRIIEDLEDDALNCLTDFGSAHCKADQENNVNYDSLRHAESVRNRQKAQRLGKEALAELHVQRQETEKQKTRAIKARKQALDVEAVRSSYIISLPPVTFIQDAQPKEEPAKVILFDKSTLFQTEYVMKDKIVEEVSHPKDAREAAACSERENQQRALDQKRQQAAEALKVKKRGHAALQKEKNHTNYLRLLETLDKMEKTNKGSPEPTGQEWDIESTATSEESSCREPSPVPRKSPLLWINDMEEIPVRDGPTMDRRNISPSLPPPPAGHDAEQLNEIGQLLRELREEQDRWTASDRARTVDSTCELSLSAGTATPSSSSKSSSSGVVVYSDDDVRVRCGLVDEGASPSSSTPADLSQRRKDLAHALRAIYKERDSLLQPDKERPVEPTRPPGILRRPAHPMPPPGPDSVVTSTPLTATKATSAGKKTVQMEEDERKRALKHYIRKLLEMRRADISKLSVSSSSSSPSSLSTATSASTPKPSSRPLHISTSTGSPEGISRLTEESSSSAYDSPAGTGHSSSHISNASSLPLGAEAAAFRRPSEAAVRPSGDGGLFSLGPLLDVYNDLYQAYNQRMRVVVEEKSPLSDHDMPATSRTSPWQQQETLLTESSFMSLTLSGTSSMDRTSTRPGLERTGQSPFSFELTLSSSSGSSSLSSRSTTSSNGREPAVNVADLAGKGVVKSSGQSRVTTASSSSSTLSSDATISGHYKASGADSSSTSSQDISMPDVDEALRRLGLPSMQAVLRR